jgi:cytoskeletal protein RodZ
MHRRFLFPLAAGVAVLLAFAPVAGGRSSLWAAESGSEKSTTTTMTDDTGADEDSDSPSTTATTRKGATSSTTATTAPGSDSGSSSSANCKPPETDRGPAPQIGDAPVAHQAGEAGEVEVERLSETELRVADVTPNDGWLHEVRSPSGPRVNVRFTRQGQSPSLIRFAASMDQAGQELHIRVTSCG